MCFLHLKVNINILINPHEHNLDFEFVILKYIKYISSVRRTYA